MIRAFVVFLCLSCGGIQPVQSVPLVPPVPESVPPVESAQHVRSAPVPADEECTGIQILVDPAPHFDCVSPMQCPLQLEVSVRNCTDAPINLRRVELLEEDSREEGEEAMRPVILFDFAPSRVGNGETFSHIFRWSRTGDYVVVATTDDGPLPGVAVQVDNPALEEAQQACRACQG